MVLGRALSAFWPHECRPCHVGILVLWLLAVEGGEEPLLVEPSPLLADPMRVIVGPEDHLLCTPAMRIYPEFAGRLNSELKLVVEGHEFIVPRHKVAILTGPVIAQSELSEVILWREGGGSAR